MKILTSKEGSCYTCGCRFEYDEPNDTFMVIERLERGLYLNEEYTVDICLDCPKCGKTLKTRSFIASEGSKTCNFDYVKKQYLSSENKENTKKKYPMIFR